MSMKSYQIDRNCDAIATGKISFSYLQILIIITMVFMMQLTYGTSYPYQLSSQETTSNIGSNSIHSIFSNWKTKTRRSLKSSNSGVKADPSNSLEDSCEGKVDANYPNYSSDCTSYYSCTGGFQATYLCSTGLRFNGAKCTSDYICPSSEGQNNNPCSGSSDGYYTDSKNPSKYYYCYHKTKVIELKCSGDKVYENHFKKCMSPKEIETLQGAWAESTCSGGKSNGFYPDLGSRCHKYYYCIGSIKTELDCAAGQVFNGEICLLESSSGFTCPK